MNSISVVVATYNRPDTLKKTIYGLEHQTRLPDQIVIADDGSGEETKQVVRHFQSRLPIPLEHVWQPDEGFRLARIRNLAIHACRGEIIVFLDGDCIPDCHFIHDHSHIARPGFFVQGKRLLVSEELTPHFNHFSANGNRLGWFFSKHIGNRHHLIRLPWLPAFTDTRMNGTRGCNMAIFRRDLEAVNGFNEAFTGWGREDSEFVARLYKYGLKRHQHPFAAICFHLWHPENKRNDLMRNDRLLAQALASKAYRCHRGLTEVAGPGGTKPDLL